MQQAIFDAVENPAAGHIVVEALAGTGKSTTIEEAVKRVDPDCSVLVCAFNTAIVDALKKRIPSDVTVASFHSFGRRCVALASSNGVEVNRFRTADMAQGIFGRSFDTKLARDFVVKLVGLAKGQAFGPTCGTQALDALADRFDLDKPRGWDRTRLLDAAVQILRAAKRLGSEIDFDDMQLAIPQFDFVFVDERQDLNPAQLGLAVAAAGAKGRIVAVGDERQAIYGFRGADASFGRKLVEELRATKLPLSVTYRCAKAIVAEANALVPELQAAPGAPAGIVRHASLEDCERDVEPGDFVLSRTNAPLVALCFRLIAAGRRAAIQGRDIGAGLAAWVKSTRASSVAELSRAIGEWRRGEVERLEALERETQGVLDRAQCLETICAGAASVSEVEARIERIFSGDAPGGRVLLSSTHRAKGLEADRVWILRDTYLAWPGVEEENLLYVAITRAKQELIYVSEAYDDAIGDRPSDDDRADDRMLFGENEELADEEARRAIESTGSPKEWA